MKRMFVSLLVLSLAITMVGSTFAQATSPNPGTGNVNFTIQNLDPATTADVSAQYVNQNGGVDITKPVTITALGSAGFPASDSGLADNWLGSVVASANTEIVAFGQAIWSDGSSADGKTNGAYEAFTQGATKLYFPSLAARQVQFSRISVQSAAAPSTSDTINFTIKLYDRTGALNGTINGTGLHLGAQQTFDLSVEKQGAGGVPDLPDDWLGSAVVESTSPIAAVATMHWNEYAAAYSGVTGGSQKASLPSVNRRFINSTWYQYTGVVVQNLDPALAANATVKWYDRMGAVLHTFTDTIPANSSHGYNTRFPDTSDIPAASKTQLPIDLGNDWNGSVVVEADTNVVAVANMQWTIDSPSSAAASAYTSAPGGYATLYVPAAFRRVTAGTWIQYTGLVVQNVGTAACTNFQVQWFARGVATPMLDYQDTLNPNISHGYNTKFNAPSSDFPTTVDVADLGDGFMGGVVITAPGCQLAAIHNTVWPAWTDNTTYNAFGK